MKNGRQNPAERRKHVRLNKHLPVRVGVQKTSLEYEGHVVNISAGGVLVRADVPIEPGELVIIMLTIAGEPQTVAVYGTVVRNDGDGVGLAFVQVSATSADLIAYLIRKWQREGAIASKR